MREFLAGKEVSYKLRTYYIQTIRLGFETIESYGFRLEDLPEDIRNEITR